MTGIHAPSAAHCWSDHTRALASTAWRCLAAASRGISADRCRVSHYVQLRYLTLQGTQAQQWRIGDVQYYARVRPVEADGGPELRLAACRLWPATRSRNGELLTVTSDEGVLSFVELECVENKLVTVQEASHGTPAVKKLHGMSYHNTSGML